MITSFVQYILLAPSYINVLNVYAVGFHDLLHDFDGSLIVDYSSQTYSAPVNSHGHALESLIISLKRRIVGYQR